MDIQSIILPLFFAVILVTAIYRFTPLGYDLYVEQNGVSVWRLHRYEELFIPYSDIRSISYVLSGPYSKLGLWCQEYQTRSGTVTVRVNRIFSPRVTIQYAGGELICSPSMPSIFISVVEEQIHHPGRLRPHSTRPLKHRRHWHHGS